MSLCCCCCCCRGGFCYCCWPPSKKLALILRRHLQACSCSCSCSLSVLSVPSLPGALPLGPTVPIIRDEANLGRFYVSQHSPTGQSCFYITFPANHDHLHLSQAFKVESIILHTRWRCRMSISVSCQNDLTAVPPRLVLPKVPQTGIMERQNCHMKSFIY